MLQLKSFRVYVRFYISPLIGDGSEINWYRPKLLDISQEKKLRISTDIIIRMRKIAGGAEPVSNWSIVKVLARDVEHQELAKHVDLFQFPVIGNDEIVSEKIDLIAKNELNQKMDELGLLQVSPTLSFKAMVEQIGKRCIDSPKFNVDDFLSEFWPIQKYGEIE